MCDFGLYHRFTDMAKQELVIIKGGSMKIAKTNIISNQKHLYMVKNSFQSYDHFDSGKLNKFLGVGTGNGPCPGGK